MRTLLLRPMLRGVAMREAFARTDCAVAVRAHYFESFSKNTFISSSARHQGNQAQRAHGTDVYRALLGRRQERGAQRGWWLGRTPESGRMAAKGNWATGGSWVVSARLS
jgi:hypothetical protein